ELPLVAEWDWLAWVRHTFTTLHAFGSREQTAPQEPISPAARVGGAGPPRSLSLPMSGIHRTRLPGHAPSLGPSSGGNRDRRIPLSGTMIEMSDSSPTSIVRFG